MNPRRINIRIVDNKLQVTDLISEESHMKDILQKLEENPNINSLILSFKNTAQLAALVESALFKKNITSLILDSCKFGQSEIENVKFEALKNIKNLTNFGYIRSAVSNKQANVIADWLTANNTLATLNFDWAGIRESGVLAIVKALSDNKSITKLNLGDNYVGDAGAKVIAEWLENNDVLQDLSITGSTLIRDEGAEAIIEALKKNDSLRNLYIHVQSQEADLLEKKFKDLQDSKPDLNLSFTISPYEVKRRVAPTARRENADVAKPPKTEVSVDKDGVEFTHSTRRFPRPRNGGAMGGMGRRSFFGPAPERNEEPNKTEKNIDIKNPNKPKS